MKTTKTHFARFKREFRRMVELLGLKHYKVVFFHSVRNPNFVAEIDVNEPGKVVTVGLTAEIPDLEGFDPELHARHEAFHLLLWRTQWLGEQRWTASDEIRDEAEAIVRRLENLKL